MKLTDLEHFKDIRGISVEITTKEGWILGDRNAQCVWYKPVPIVDTPAELQYMFGGPDRFKNAVGHYLAAYPEARSSTNSTNT